MKIKPEFMKDGRIILHITENDGSPIVTQELSKEQSMGLVLGWTRTIMREQGTNLISIEMEREKKEMLMQLRNSEQKVEPDKKQEND